MNKYIDNDNGTVTDLTTGLMWQQGTDEVMTWDEAIRYCNNLKLAGHKDWRLPTVQELFSIVDFDKYNPAIETVYFPDTKSSNYWSSTTDAHYTDDAWLVYFYSGYVNDHLKFYAYYVRAVRSI